MSIANMLIGLFASFTCVGLGCYLMGVAVKKEFFLGAFRGSLAFSFGLTVALFNIFLFLLPMVLGF